MTGGRHPSAVWLVAGAIVALALVVASATSFARPRSGDGTLLVATSARVHERPQAVFQRSGTVRAVRHGRLVCFATVPDGDRLVFPDGYSASRSLQLRDAAGAVVATSGFAVGLAFSRTRVRAPAECGRGPARAVVRIHGLGDGTR